MADLDKKVMAKLGGKEIYKNILSLLVNQLVSYDQLIDIAGQVSGTLQSKVKIYISDKKISNTYDRRSSLRNFFREWESMFASTEDEKEKLCIQRLVNILQDEDVGLISLAQEIDEAGGIPCKMSQPQAETSHSTPQDTRAAATNIQYNTTTHYYGTVTINQFLDPLHPHLKQNLDEGQKEWIQQNLHCLTTLLGCPPGSEKSIIKFETILNSVCMIEGGSGATGFIAKIPNHGIAFMTAGHCFKGKIEPGNIDFNDYNLHFGNIDGGNSNAVKKCKLGDLGDSTTFRGSIGHKGKRRNFPGNSLQDALQFEDYCILLFDDSKRQHYGLSSLDCGEDNYLTFTPDGAVSIFGHPGKGCKEGSERPLRMSYGIEKEANLNGSTAEKSGNFLFFDYDSLSGNSGSPVIGRGDANGNGYAVKGIHVAGMKAGPRNAAQSLKKLDTWIPCSTVVPVTSTAPTTV